MKLRIWHQGVAFGLLAFFFADLAVAAPQATFLNFGSGAVGISLEVYGNGLGTDQGSVYFIGPNQTSTNFPGQVSTTTVDSNAQTVAQVFSWTYNVIDLAVPGGLSWGTYMVQVQTSGGTYANSLPFEVTAFGGDVKPHGDYSTATDFCLQCHRVHSSDTPYALLQAPNVQDVCASCHTISDTTDAGVTAPGIYTNPGFSDETVATTAHYAVFKNASPTSGHFYGATKIPDSVSISLGYLHLNTTSYESVGYGSTEPDGLYCGSCHTPHGDFSANIWSGWDAAQFSQNYGYNADGSAYGAGNNWTYNIPGGALPLTTALLIRNPGHQGGIDNPSTNPNIPITNDYPVSRNWQQTTPGWTDDNLSNFCVGCHNVNGGVYSDSQGHPTHPLQAILSPDNAGISTVYSSIYGAYDSISNGCTDCHGSSIPNPPGVAYGGLNVGYFLAYPSLSQGYNLQSTWDFPHTSTNPDLLQAYPDGICLSCHGHSPSQSSLP